MASYPQYRFVAVFVVSYPQVEDLVLHTWFFGDRVMAFSYPLSTGGCAGVAVFSLRTWLHTWFFWVDGFLSSVPGLRRCSVSYLLVEDWFAYLGFGADGSLSSVPEFVPVCGFLTFWLRTWLHIWF